MKKPSPGEGSGPPQTPLEQTAGVSGREREEERKRRDRERKEGTKREREEGREGRRESLSESDRGIFISLSLP